MVPKAEADLEDLEEKGLVLHYGNALHQARWQIPGAGQREAEEAAHLQLHAGPAPASAEV